MAFGVFNCLKCGGFTRRRETSNAVIAGSKGLIHTRECLAEGCGHRSSTYEMDADTVAVLLKQLPPSAEGVYQLVD